MADTSVEYDWGAMVEQHEPDRNKPTVEYEFSNGREFERVAGESYADDD